MIWEIIKAAFITTCLAAFFSINLYNILKWQFPRKKDRNVKVHAEIPLPEGLPVALVSFGTFIFFSESILYCTLVFAGYTGILSVFPLQLHSPFNFYIEVLGLTLTGSGYILFIWSVLARGRYATSWAMPENHKLVTWGPYRYVRHPSYSAYFLMFIGLFLVWLNVIAVLPLMAVPGYVYVSQREEELLLLRFGDEYRKYQSTTGKFFPKLKNRTSK
jgi:protein-S-isoprenylcysteine O-methyltransferase Ste14